MSLAADILPWHPGFSDAVLALLVEPRIGMATFCERLPRDDVERHVSDVWRREPTVHDLRCAAVDGAGRLVGAGCVEGGSLSYFVDPCFWGRGIATALATHLCRLALSEHPPAPVVAWVERDNRASERVLEKCRFRFAGLYRHGAGAARAPSGRRALLRYELHP